MASYFYQHGGSRTNMAGIFTNLTAIFTNRTAKSLAGRVWAWLLAECSLKRPEKFELFRDVNAPQFLNKKIISFDL
ncbi:MAG: hypothetical protein Q8R96_13975 [Bacteroidota bacterium]|nr:hypothetical protein [Bacteroidota bacterium]